MQAYGIGELRGRLYHTLSAPMVAELRGERGPCPFAPETNCAKAGAVCSLRLYDSDGEVAVPIGPLVTTCPKRFLERDEVYSWVSQVILGCSEPEVLGEQPFLQSRTGDGDAGEGGFAVARIDNVLVHPDLDHLRWCALEKQAVCFSGAEMGVEFARAADWTGPWPAPPVGRRRPDFRSSGPKRLMPQLQIKVPTLRRWGKKMAVVVDEAFFDSLAPMVAVSDVSNCDIVWFVVRYEIGPDHATLQRGSTCNTTLENAVDGLTAGKPLSLRLFEERLIARLQGLRGG